MIETKSSSVNVEGLLTKELYGGLYLRVGKRSESADNLDIGGHSFEFN